MTYSYVVVAWLGFLVLAIPYMLQVKFDDRGVVRAYNWLGETKRP